MKLMLLGLLVFIGAHAFTTMRVARAGVVAKIGEGPYKGLYSLVSIAGLFMIGYGFAAWRGKARRSFGIRRSGPSTSRSC